MPNITYEIVEHDGGWAYKVDGTFSETFPTHSEALAAAEVAATEQEIPGHTETIEYEDDKGKWHTEMASGRGRPHVIVKDKHSSALDRPTPSVQPSGLGVKPGI